MGHARRQREEAVRARPLAPTACSSSGEAPGLRPAGGALKSMASIPQPRQVAGAGSTQRRYVRHRVRTSADDGVPHQRIVQPPSTTRVWPVISDAAEENRKTTAPATSRGRPMRCHAAMRLTTSSRNAESDRAAAVPSVSTKVGAAADQAPRRGGRCHAHVQKPADAGVIVACMLLAARPTSTTIPPARSR